MAGDPKTQRRVLAGYAAKRARAESALVARREEIYRDIPRIAEIDASLVRLMSRVVASALGENANAERAASEAVILRREKRDLLRECGYSEDYLDEKYSCPLCRDTGYIGPEPCECFKNAMRLEQNRELSLVLDVNRQSFDSFRLDYYSDEIDPARGISPRENMEGLFDYLVNYATHFGPRSGNVFLNGGTGLGKTFLCCCVASEVVNRGSSVVYASAYALFEHYEADRFGKSADAKDEIRRYLVCDLLILDDLGTEMTTPFTVSALYNLISARLAAGRKTIINSNLSMAELERRYSPQIASRLIGEYEGFALFGEDIRLLRKRVDG